jgi:DNA polymerase-3 subunit alpha
MPVVVPPKIPSCEQWPLTELLEHEKEVTGMFMSGHPLDHFRFEIRHYGITQIGEFNEIKEAISLQANPGKNYRLAGLVVDAQHRVTRTGRQFGSFVMEDYTGKCEFMLWSDDYTRYAHYLEKGKNLFVTGYFKQRYNKSEFEFKVDKVILLESIKQNLTRQVIVDVEAKHINEELIDFIEKNVKSHPGKSSLKFNIVESRNNLRSSMYTLENGFEMNDEMAGFLQEKPELDVQVVTV